MDTSAQHSLTTSEEHSTILTVHDLACYLHLSEAMIYRMARANKLPYVKLGKALRFNKTQIDEWFLALAKKNQEAG
jgi:excisionase family DNA binding protein